MKPVQALILSALLSAAAFGAAQAAETKPAFKADAAKGQALAQVCAACHTADGSRGSPANPILQSPS